MSGKLNRSRTIQSGSMQVLGGVLVLSGTLAGTTDGLSTWQMWAGLAFGIYFLAAGGYRVMLGWRMPREDKKK